MDGARGRGSGGKGGSVRLWAAHEVDESPTAVGWWGVGMWDMCS